MTVIGDIKRIVLLVISFSAGVWMVGILLGSNQIAYAQYNKDAYLQLQPTEQNAEIKQIVFPFAVEGTSLVAEALVYYDGPLLEGGSDEELFNAAAVLLRNTSSEGVAWAKIVMETDESWVFLAQDIPPMGTVLVVESSGAVLSDTPVLACTGWAVTEEDGWEYNDLIHIEPADMGSITVTNITESELKNIRIIYKNWLPESEILVGGISFETCVDRLMSGQTITLQPERYAKGYSIIVRILADKA